VGCSSDDNTFTPRPCSPLSVINPPQVRPDPPQSQGALSCAVDAEEIRTYLAAESGRARNKSARRTLQLGPHKSGNKARPQKTEARCATAHVEITGLEERCEGRASERQQRRRARRKSPDRAISVPHRPNIASHLLGQPRETTGRGT